jgi:two-component system, NarL family, response regulator DevR
MSNAEGGSERLAVKIFLLVESRILRETLARLFRKRSDLRVVGECQYSDASLADILKSQCDVLLIDHSAANSSPTDLVTKVLAKSADMGIVLFGMEEDPREFLHAVQAGVVGYLPKNASTGDILAAVRGVAQGEAVCPPKLCFWLLKHISRESLVTPRMPNHRLGKRLGLTKRQQQLAPLVAMGLSNKEIAIRLNLSEFTVKNHMHRLMKQLDAETRYEAIESIRAKGFTFDTNLQA